jgi:hypothetical protein
MFAIKFIDGMHQETSFHVYAYTVNKPINYTKDHPMITMSLDRDVFPDKLDSRTINVEVTDSAFVINEAGKTIDRIKSYYVPVGSVGRGTSATE